MIDAYMDLAWEQIEIAIQFMAATVDRLLVHFFFGCQNFINF